MSDEKDEGPEAHGIPINPNGHEHALRYLQEHMGREQLEEMVHRAKTSSDRKAHFTAHVDGHDVKYKIEHHDGKLTIYKSEH